MAENSLDDLITYIGIEVYGREMRKHIKEAFEILAQSSLTAEEKAKIADSVLYTPQTLNDDQKQIARSNIGAAKAGDSGRGWTEEQIGLFEAFKNELEAVFAKIGYKDNSAEGPGQTAAKAAIDRLEDLIESLRSVPVELLSITLALREGVSPIAGQAITSSELVVTGHYSDSSDREIESGYTITPETWAYPSTDVSVKYNDITSNPITVPVAREPAATISIDNASDTDHLDVTVKLGGEEVRISKGSPYAVYDTATIVEISIALKTSSEGKYVIDSETTEVTMNGNPMLFTGGKYVATSISGNIVIKAISKALPERINATYEGGTVPAGTTLAQLTGITVTATYYDENVVTLTSEQYELSVAGGGDLVTGENTVDVAGKGEYVGLTDDFKVTVEAAPTPTTKATGEYKNTEGVTVKTTGAVNITPESGTGFVSEPNQVTVEYTGGITPVAYNFYKLILTRSGSAWTVKTIKNGNNASNLIAGDSATVTFGSNYSSVTISDVNSHTASSTTPTTNGGFHPGTTYSVTCEVV